MWQTVYKGPLFPPYLHSQGTLLIFAVDSDFLLPLIDYNKKYSLPRICSDHIGKGLKWVNHTILPVFFNDLFIITLQSSPKKPFPTDDPLSTSTPFNVDANYWFRITVLLDLMSLYFQIILFSFFFSLHTFLHTMYQIILYVTAMYLQDLLFPLSFQLPGYPFSSANRIPLAHS